MDNEETKVEGTEEEMAATPGMEEAELTPEQKEAKRIQEEGKEVEMM